MFTGIIERMAKVERMGGSKLVLATPAPWPDPLEIGESIAVDGCCLTLTESVNGLHFDLSEETLSRTHLGTLKAGDLVNLERAMAMGSRLGGHLVQGHVDATGTFLGSEELAGSHIVTFLVPRSGQTYMIEKGSIAINGISLTIASLKDEPEGCRVSVVVIPHTWSETNLRTLVTGQSVNLEFDMVAKYIERIVSHAPADHD